MENKDLERTLESLRIQRASAAAEIKRLTETLAAYDQAISALSVLVGGGSGAKLTLHRVVAAGGDGPNQRALWEEALDLMKERGVDMPHADVVSGLLARGVVIDSPTPANIVHSALSRKPDIFVRVKRGVWGLLSSHPELAEQSVLQVEATQNPLDTKMSQALR